MPHRAAPPFSCPPHAEAGFLVPSPTRKPKTQKAMKYTEFERLAAPGLRVRNPRSGQAGSVVKARSGRAFVRWDGGDKSWADYYKLEPERQEEAEP